MQKANGKKNKMYLINTNGKFISLINIQLKKKAEEEERLRQEAEEAAANKEQNE